MASSNWAPEALRRRDDGAERPGAREPQVRYLAVLELPELLTQAHEVEQWVGIGPSTFNRIYVAVPAGTSVPARASEFVNDNGTIECDNWEVQAQRTDGIPVTHHDPTQQGTTCFVKGYTGPTAGQRCVGLPWFTVHLDFGSYPTTVTCSGDEPMELSPDPYQLHDGGSVDLGGATCTESDPDITCVSNSFEGTSFTVSQTGISIPIAPGDTVKLGEAGLAEPADVKPDSINISADGTFYIKRVRYTAWTLQDATGTGILYARSSHPELCGRPAVRHADRVHAGHPDARLRRFLLHQDLLARADWRPEGQHLEVRATDLQQHDPGGGTARVLPPQ